LIWISYLKNNRALETLACDNTFSNEMAVYIEPVDNTLRFQSLEHVQVGEVPLDVGISPGGTPPVVTTDFDYLYLTT